MNVVYYKFKSAKCYESLAMHDSFISVWNLKEKIVEAKHLERGTYYDLLLTNAQTNEDGQGCPVRKFVAALPMIWLPDEWSDSLRGGPTSYIVLATMKYYTDEEMLVPRNTSVLVCRVPGPPHMRIVIKREEESKVEEVSNSKSTVSVADSSDMRSLNPEESEGYDFGNDLFAIPEVVPVQLSNLVQNDQSKAKEDRKVEINLSKAEEDRRIKALVNTPALDMQWKTMGTFRFGGCFGRAMGDRMVKGHGFGRGGLLEHKTPPKGYICHRCKVPGHFIQYCPTNGDPSYNIKRLKHPTGILRSMLMDTPNGSYALPSGAVAVIKPNEDAFVKEIEGLPSTRSVSDIPPELHCPLCKEVMKDAAMTGKCCFRSFCDKCIREHIISKSMCACGATNILADSLIPNKTLRETINRVLESTISSTQENAGSLSNVQESNSCTLSAPVKEEHIPPSHKDNTSNRKRPADEEKLTTGSLHRSLERSKTTTNTTKSEVTVEAISGKVPASLGVAPLLAEEKVQQNLRIAGPGMKKRKQACKAANVDKVIATARFPCYMQGLE